MTKYWLDRNGTIYELRELDERGANLMQVLTGTELWTGTYHLGTTYKPWYTQKDFYEDILLLE